MRMKTTIAVLLIIVLEGCITVQPCVCPQVEKIEQAYYQPQFYPPKFNTIPYKGINLGEGDILRLTRPIMLPIPQSEIIKLL